MLASLGDLVEDVIVRLDGPVNVASDTHAAISRRRGGSAANVVARAAALGHPARFLGQVGTDAIGTALIADLHDDGVDASMVRRGPRSALVHLVEGSTIEVQASAVPGVNDTTGAGDAFAAGLLTFDGWVDDPVAACNAGHRAAAELLRNRAGQ